LPKNCEHLFEVIMRRYENRSTIMTIPGGVTGLKTTPPLPEKRTKTKRPNPSPTNLRPQNRRAEWLASGSARFTLLLYDYGKRSIFAQWFVPQLVGDLMAAGVLLGAGQCYSYRTPPRSRRTNRAC
jgi:Fe-S oxidoreductase